MKHRSCIYLEFIMKMCRTLGLQPAKDIKYKSMFVKGVKIMIMIEPACSHPV